MKRTLPLPVFVLLTLMVCASVHAQSLPAWGPPFSTDQARAYTCVRAQGPIQLDGKLDEAAWGKGQQVENFIVAPAMNWMTFAMDPARRAGSRTHARLLWDDKYLYVGAEMEDRDLYCVTPKGHDLPWAADDVIELFVKPSDDKPYYWELHVVPSGGTRDYFYARRGAGNAARWIKYQSGMQAAVTTVGTLDDWTDRDTKWTAELRVPWSAFDRWGGKPKVGDLWRFLLSRYDYSVHLEDGVELSAAAPLSWQNFHQFEEYPYLTFAVP
jgi:hypothetical protein